MVRESHRCNLSPGCVENFVDFAKRGKTVLEILHRATKPRPRYDLEFAGDAAQSDFHET